LLQASCGDEDVEGLAHDAERARELTFAMPVPVRRISNADYAAEERARVAKEPDAELRSYAETYGRFGFFPVGLDLRPILATANTETVAAYYASSTGSSTGSITLLGRSSRDTIVHEFVHGLQDQHFGLSGDLEVMTSDAVMARAAVVEGDATLAQLRYLASEEGIDFGRVSFRTAFDTYGQFTDSLLRGPFAPLFSAYASFAYTYGVAYCAANLTGATDARPIAQLPAPFDWTREDALFAGAMPMTTQGVLMLRAEAAPTVGLRDVPPALADRFELVDWDSLGEWHVFLLLVPLEHCSDSCRSGTTRAMVSGWNGDGVLFVRQRETGANGFVWASSWTGADAAQGISSAVAQLHGFVPGTGDPRVGLARDGEPMWLEVRDTRVVVIKNIDAAAAAAFAAAALGANTTALVTAVPSRPRSRPTLAALLSAR
jgi:hypothetical protein